MSEVFHSSWIAGLERMNAVHPSHSPSLFRSYRHYVFAFHDSTFECVAKDLVAEVEEGRPALIRKRVVEELG